MTRMWENRVNGASGVVRDTEPAGQGRGAVGAAGPPADRAPDRSAHGGDTGSAAGLGDRNGHSRCVLCGALHPRSWRLPFTPAADDRIRAEFVASEDLQGYDGLLHGGVIAEICHQAIGGGPRLGFVLVENASVSSLVVHGPGQWRLRSFNDTTHLRNPD